MSTYNDASLIYYPSGYKAGEAYSLKPTDGSGDLTFTRASSATRVNESGLIESVATGVPRIDYTSGCGKLLLEPQRTNLIPYSQDFSNAFWIKTSATVTTSTVVSPDGLQGSYKLIPDNGTGGNRSISNNYTSLAGLHTHTCFAKKGEYNYLMLRTRNNPSAGVMFDLANGTLSVNLTSPVYVSSQIENYGNGWYRCSITLDPSQADTVGQLFISMCVGITGSEGNSFNGDGTSGIYIFGSSLEQGSYPTSYIPTSGVAVTRVADSASKSGISSLINGSEGVVFIDMAAFQDTATTREIIIGSSPNDYIRFGYVNFGSAIQFRYYSGGALIFNKFYTSTITNFNKIAFGWQANNFVVYENGVKKLEQLSGATSAAAFNSIDTSTLTFQGKIQSFMIFKTRLDNATLAALTTL